MRLIRLALMMCLALATSWSGPERRAVLGDRPDIESTSVPLDPANPARVRIGGLTYLGGVVLSSRDGAFGGFSSMSVAGDRFTLLSDGGNIVRFRMDQDFRVTDPAFGDLPAGPAWGWEKHDRDSESMAVDPASGTVWVGFERTNQIWQYASGMALPAAGAAPPGMARWERNGGPESMVRLHDGRFLVIAETDRHGGATRELLVFSGDPVAHPDSNVLSFYRPPEGYDPSDVAELPDGRVLVLNRKIALPFRWGAVLMLIDLRAIRPGAVVAGREIARFAAPLTVDNFEGLAVTREDGATILWMVSDDNQFVLQRTLLMKFRLSL